MKLALGIVCLMMAVYVQGAPQAGPPPPPPGGYPEGSLTPACEAAKCPADKNVILEYPLDCLQYIECTNGVAKVKGCPGDQVYSQAAGGCADRSTANCVPCWQRPPSP